MSVADQIKKWRKAAGLTQQELADELGVTRSAINQWEKKAPKLRHEHKLGLSRTLGRPPSAFEEFGGGTVTPADGKRHAIQLLEWEDLKHLSVGGKMLKEALKRPTYIDVGEDISKKSKALVISDDSMAPVFQPGDEIIIDPDVRPKDTDGDDPDYVLVRVVKTKEEVFRRYIPRRGGAYDLQAENPDGWDTISISSRNPGEMLGVLVEHRRKRRTG